MPRTEPAIFFRVPVAADGAAFSQGAGDPGRDSDHGTVAMNNDRDVVVAFHTVRENDLITPFVYAGELKQVELAYFEYRESAGVGAWVHIDTGILGSIDWSPLSIGTVSLVRCERPDVVAVDDKFFVVWTRRYDRDTPGVGDPGDNEPAVLECAWVGKNAGSTGLDVYADPAGNDGLGYSLDFHIGGPTAFEIRECAGVADAVVLSDPLHPNHPYNVAVVYPHQKEFARDTGNKRKFDLRVVTCSLDTSQPTPVISKTTYNPIALDLAFNGDPAPGGIPSPGLVLPDLAPSKEDNAFWLAYEEQVEREITPSSTGVPEDVAEGKIRLKYMTLSGGQWSPEATKTFKTPGGGPNYNWRRRPMISSYPDEPNHHLVSISYGTANSNPDIGDDSTNIFYEQWEYLNGGLSSPPSLPSPLTVDWPNLDTAWDDRPAPLMGRASPFIRRCYATRIDDPAFPQRRDLFEFDPVYPSTLKIIDSDTDVISSVSRPAAAFLHFPGAVNPDYFAVTWEKRVDPPDNILRVFLTIQ